MAELDKLSAMTGFLKQGLWFLGQTQGFRIMGLNIKVEPGGLLGILKVVTAEGPKVAFIQAEDLEKLYRELQRCEDFDQVRWKPDKFALDKRRT